MGTSIELTVSGVSLSYSKNHMGLDHGFLFQDGDRSRVKSEQISYKWYEEHPEEKAELEEHEAAFVRPLRSVLPRLDLLGYTLDTARAEYEAHVGDEVKTAAEYSPIPAHGFMSFNEFCAFCGRIPLQALDETVIDFGDSDRNTKSQGRFASLAEEMQRIPGSLRDQYWSEQSFCGASLAILSWYSMLQVFGQHAHNADAPVIWEFGPLVHSGWAEATDFYAGARREQTILVATEGTSDARILKRALEVIQPDVADFFRFIDVNERHHFWGTGALTKFAEGLVRIDVQNKVLFVLDNDAEGVEAFGRLQSLKMPVNMRAMVLPELEAFRQFSTRGPEGVTQSDINGRAAGMECYLDLTLPGRLPAQVIWTNYKPGLDAWHGALEHKDSFADHFYKQDDAALVAKHYDASKLRAVLAALLQEATQLSEMPKWLRSDD